MSPEGMIYRGPEVEAAIMRGEQVMPVSEGFADQASHLSPFKRERLGRALANIRATNPGIDSAEAERLAMAQI